MQPLPIVLLHGIRVTGTMWRPQLRRLEQATAPDLPGHGSRHREEFTMESAIAAAARAIDDLGGKALVVGASMGGYVGIALAARHPDKVAGLIGIGCTAQATPTRALPYQLLARLSGSMGEAVHRWMFRRLLGRQAAQDATAGGIYPQAIPQFVQALLNFDPIAALHDFDGPVWLVNGRWDQFRSEETQFLAACRDGRLIVVPRAGHLVNLTHPDEVTRIIQSAAASL